MLQLFDTFNSRSAFGRGTKTPIKSANLYDKIHFLLKAKGYLLSMTTATGERVCIGRKSFCLVGFIFSINSLINLTLELFGPNHEQTHIKYLLTYKLSQDHLELLFSSIRSYMRWNNNPNALQFTYAMRAMMCKAGLTPSVAANIWSQDDTQLLGIPTTTNQLDSDASNSNSIQFEDSVLDNCDFIDIVRLSDYVENIVKYIAGWVIKKMLPAINCREAIVNVAIPTEQSLLLQLRNKGGLYHTSKDITTVAIFTEKAIRFHSKTIRATSSNTQYIKIESTVLQSVPADLFITSAEHFKDTYNSINSHYTSLVRVICRTYLDLRCHHMAKLANDTEKESLCQKLTHTILFMNQ